MATFYEDWSGKPAGVGIPAGWTVRSPGDVYEYSIVSEFGAFNSTDLTGGKALRISGGGVTTQNQVLTLDAAGMAVQCDIVARITASWWTNEGVGPVARAAPSEATNGWSAWTLQSDRLRARANGTATTVDHNLTMSVENFYYLRYLLDGTSVKATMAATLADVLGAAPAAGWLVNVGDPSPSVTGHMGIAVREPNISWCVDWIGIGTDGDVAPTAVVQPPENLAAQQVPAVMLTWDDTGGLLFDVRKDGTTVIATGLDGSPYIDTDTVFGDSPLYEVRYSGSESWSGAVSAELTSPTGVKFLRPDGLSGWSVSV